MPAASPEGYRDTIPRRILASGGQMMRRELGWMVLVVAMACGGSEGEEETAAEETTGEEAESESILADQPHPVAGTGIPPLADDASEDAHQAEYIRGELHRLDVQLSMHLEAEDIPCEEAASTRDEICDIAGQICALDTTDPDVSMRCDAGNEECETARSEVAQHCG